MYTFGFKWFEKPLWVINVKFYVIVTDMFHKYRIRSIKEFCKNGVLDKNASESFIKKVAGQGVLRIWQSVLRTSTLKSLCKVAVNNYSK